MMKKIFTVLYIACLTLSVTAGGQKEGAPADQPVRIGVMPDAGALPLFLMEGVETVPFMSAKERDTAMQLGELDGIMTDMVAVVSYGQRGMPLKVMTITESRFLLVGHPGFSEEDTWSVGLSENTVIEFMVDQLAQGIDVEKVGIPQVPVRMEMLRNGKIPLACLTDAMAWPLLSRDFPIVRDQADTDLEPAVLAFSAEYAGKNSHKLADFSRRWDEAVDKINASPEEYRSLLLEKIRLPEDTDHPYPMPVFRSIQLPPEGTVEKVLTWFDEKYGLTSPVSYGDLMLQGE